MNDLKEWGKQLKRARLAADLSPRAAALFYEISESYLFKIEAGEYNPSPRIVGNIARLYGREIEYREDYPPDLPARPLKREKLRVVALIGIVENLTVTEREKVIKYAAELGVKRKPIQIDLFGDTAGK